MKFILLGLASLFSLTTAFSANLQLATAPLYLGNGVEPNVFFEIDDSGSMDWEILSKKHWEYCAYDPDAGSDNNSSSNCGSEIDTGKMKLYNGSDMEGYVYIYNNSDDAYSNNSCNSSDYKNKVENCTQSSIDKDWRLKSSALNVIYYNPAANYEPWVGTGMADANFSQARSDPEPTSSGYSQQRNLDGFVYHVWSDSHGWTSSDSRPKRGSSLNRTTGENSLVDHWDEHVKCTVNNASLTIEEITYTPTNNDIGKSSNTVVPTFTKDCEGSDKDSSECACTNGKSLTEIKTNVANWYQYSRRRSFVTKSAVATVIDEYPSFRYGLSVINDYSTLYKTVPPSSDNPPFASHNLDVISSLFQLDWPDDTTPLRKGLERVGQYFDNTDGKTDPIINSCQQHFAILFTDGYWSGSDPSSSIGDADGDGHSKMLSDVAKYYYDKDLSSLANEVLPGTFDTATHQHMVTLGVAFGVSGLLTDSDASGWPDSGGTDLLESGNWGDPDNSDPEKIDDLWHASFNSKGKYINASSASEVVTALNSAITAIADRTSSASAVVSNATSLSTDSLIFQPKFDSGTWAGELLAIVIDTSANLGSTSWNAATVLDSISYSNRIILTYNGTRGVPFAWPSDYQSPTSTEISSSQVTELLNKKPGAYTSTSDIQSYGGKVVNYLRGDASNEGTTAIPRTERVGKLGDIVHSAPVYVEAPSLNYADDWIDKSLIASGTTNSVEPEDSVSYTSFKTAQASRSSLVYVGANDGMMHGFFAEKTTRNSHVPGEELIAYVPSAVMQNLPKLTVEPYEHSFLVDGQTAVGDVLYSSAWHTVLVGSLRSGGQGIYALDITSPDSFAENLSNSLVLWEFNDSDDADLGYTFSEPAIVRLHNGKWAAIFGNGYNNTIVDSAYSQDDDGTTDSSTQGDEGQAVLYIVDIQTGSLIKKFETKVGISHSSSNSLPNGLSSPVAYDYDNDDISDYIYAGDLYGNLWKFDVSSTDKANWDIAFSGKPLFTACSGTCTNTNHQPITSRPTIGPHTDSNRDGYLVYFGTGKYIEATDNSVSGQQTQTFYGVWDKGASWSAYSRSNLLEQKILKEITQSYDTNNSGSVDTSYNLRYTSQQNIDWNTQSGWFMDLVNNAMDNYVDTPTNTNNYGERQISNSILRNGKIIFTTLLPSTNVCQFGTDSYTMDLDPATGGRLGFVAFDLNNDGKFDDDDKINIGDIDGDGNDDYVAPSGIKSAGGGGTSPIILEKGITNEYKVTSGSDGNIKIINENPNKSADVKEGRVSWNEIL